jgi:site-specific recombinase XerC
MDRVGAGGHRAAVVAQQAMALELLQTIPLRIGNLVRLRLDRHLSPLAVREGHALIMIPGHEVKNRRALRYPVMRQSCPQIRTYLERFHPRLAGADSPWLFPGRKEHKHVGTLSSQLTKLLRTEMGLDFHPHLFRHFAGEHYLDAYENDLEGAANLLGHDRTVSVRRFYTSPRMKAAVERFDQVVLRLRSGLPAATTRKKKR